MNKALPLTKYHQIYLVLREQLQEGRFAEGMPAEMFVRTGERSLLNYLFKPLLDRANSALTEE